MKSTEAMSDETARDLFGMVFDQDGVAVPTDDLAPAAMAGYTRYRRRRTAVLGAGTSALVLAVAVVAVVTGGAGKGAGTAPETGIGAVISPRPQASPSAPGPGGSRLVDCFSNFEATGDRSSALKAQADCRRAEPLWQAVFPGAGVSGARNPTVKQVTDGFLARVRIQDASRPSLYGRPQAQVLEDWTEARQQDADAGFQSWSGFNIQTGEGTITVSAVFRSGQDTENSSPCLGASPCRRDSLSDGSAVEVAGDDHGYQVSVRSQNGDAYQFSFTSHFDPRYVDVPCEGPGGHCYADLTDGSIQPGLMPDTSAVIGTPVVTEAVLTGILHRPAFLALVQGYFDSALGKPGS